MSFDPKATLAGVCWDTTGNTGNLDGSNFIGNIDNVPLSLRSNNTVVARFSKPTAGTTNVVLGSSTNAVVDNAVGVAIAGGGLDGGPVNRVSDNYGTVGGGLTNLAGDENGSAANAEYATVSGGSSNYATGRGSAVGGGFGNVANTGDLGYSTIAGGADNTATGDYATVPGGRTNRALGDYSFAAGRRARVRGAIDTGEAVGTCGGGDTCGDEGTFVWADAQNADFVSSGPNQFLVRADGGMHVNTNVAASGNDDVTFKTRPNSGDADIDIRLVPRTGNATLLFVGSASGTFNVNPSPVASNARMLVGGGTGGTASLTYGGVWTNASSRTYKENLTSVDPQSILGKVLALPITSWQYRGSSEGTHMGPMAEDFKAAFDLAGDGKSIGTVDADGVALAAIQGLNQKLETRLAQENALLRAELDAMRARLDALEGGHTAPEVP